MRFLREADWKFFVEIAAVNSAFASTISMAFVSSGRPVMPLKSKSRTTTIGSRRPGRAGTDGCARRLPRKRPPTHPGEMLLDEFLKPLGISQSALAARLGVSFPRLNEIIRKKRSLTPDTALRLERVLGMPADFWLGLQTDWDLWHALHGRNVAEIRRLVRLTPEAENGPRNPSTV